LSGYSIEDILLQDALLDAVEDAVLDVVVAPAELMPVFVVGAPLRYRHRIYNTAVVVHRGRVLGVVPKSYLPTSRSSTNADSSPPATICTAPSGWATWMCRSDPACFSPRPTCPASC